MRLKDRWASDSEEEEPKLHQVTQKKVENAKVKAAIMDLTETFRPKDSSLITIHQVQNKTKQNKKKDNISTNKIFFFFKLIASSFYPGNKSPEKSTDNEKQLSDSEEKQEASLESFDSPQKSLVDMGHIVEEEIIESMFSLVVYRIRGGFRIESNSQFFSRVIFSIDLSSIISTVTPRPPHNFYLCGCRSVECFEKIRKIDEGIVDRREKRLDWL